MATANNIRGAKALRVPPLQRLKSTAADLRSVIDRAVTFVDDMAALHPAAAKNLAAHVDKALKRSAATIRRTMVKHGATDFPS